MFCVNFSRVIYSAVNHEGQVAPRTGFMYNFQQREMLIKCWDPITEGILHFTQFRFNTSLKKYVVSIL